MSCFHLWNCYDSGTVHHFEGFIMSALWIGTMIGLVVFALWVGKKANEQEEERKNGNH